MKAPKKVSFPKKKFENWTTKDFLQALKAQDYKHKMLLKLKSKKK